MLLADLNERTKSRFGATDSARHLIVKLLKDGYLVGRFQTGA